MVAYAVATPVVVCCLCAVLLSSCVSTASGAWPWEVGLLKNKNATTEAPASQTPNVTTVSPTVATAKPPTVETTPRSRPRSRGKKHHPHTTSTPQPSTKDVTINTTSTTEASPPSIPPVAVETEPQFLAPVQPQLAAAPPGEMSPIVIVEPDAFSDGGRTYRSMYEQPYGGMYPPPMPYSAPFPYYSQPPVLSPYPPMYDPYSFGGYPSYQWPAAEPSYQRPYRSYPFAPVPSVGGYPSDYPPYPWWNPQVQGMATGAAAAENGCSSEPKRDREEMTPALKDVSVDQNAEDPSPTYVSLLPGFGGALSSLDTSKPSTVKESSERAEDPEQRDADQPNNAPGKESHILRNNPYQPQSPGPYWPGYYGQSQWQQWSPWQQWRGGPQQQFAPPAAPQPSEALSQKRQAPAYGWRGPQYG